MNTMNYKTSEIAALFEFNSKYDLGIKIDHTKESQVLFSIYHFGYETIKNAIKKEYLKTFEMLTKNEWLYLLKDMEAILSQLTVKNVNDLINDINKC